MTQHATKVKPVKRNGRRVRAWCPCGWRGQPRNHHGTAAADGMTHETEETTSVR